MKGKRQVKKLTPTLLCEKISYTFIFEGLVKILLTIELIAL